jgi:hypothetical protein
MATVFILRVQSMDKCNRELPVSLAPASISRPVARFAAVKPISPSDFVVFARLCCFGMDTGTPSPSRYVMAPTHSLSPSGGRFDVRAPRPSSLRSGSSSPAASSPGSSPSPMASSSSPPPRSTLSLSIISAACAKRLSGCSGRGPCWLSAPCCPADEAPSTGPAVDAPPSLTSMGRASSMCVLLERPRSCYHKSSCCYCTVLTREWHFLCHSRGPREPRAAGACAVAVGPAMPRSPNARVISVTSPPTSGGTSRTPTTQPRTPSR